MTTIDIDGKPADAVPEEDLRNISAVLLMIVVAFALFGW
jgi:hypothetical protein